MDNKTNLKINVLDKVTGNMIKGVKLKIEISEDKKFSKEVTKIVEVESDGKNEIELNEVHGCYRITEQEVPSRYLRGRKVKYQDFIITDKPQQIIIKHTPKTSAWKRILLGLLIGALLAVGTWAYMNSNRVTNNNLMAEDPSAGQYVQETKEPKKMPKYKVAGFKSATIKANHADTKLKLENPEGNNVYFKFELALKDTGEVLYTSNLVKPGLGIYNQTLSRTLEKGTYQAVLKIKTFTLDEQKPRNATNMNFDLIVE